MGLIWPTRLNPDPNMFTRLGRAAHWLGLVLAVALLAGAAPVLSSPSADASAIWWFGGIALALYMAARCVRYVLASE